MDPAKVREAIEIFRGASRLTIMVAVDVFEGLASVESLEDWREAALWWHGETARLGATEEYDAERLVELLGKLSENEKLPSGATAFLESLLRYMQYSEGDVIEELGEPAPAWLAWKWATLLTGLRENKLQRKEGR